MRPLTLRLLSTTLGGFTPAGSRCSYGPKVTSLPLWAVYCVSFGAPLAALTGVLFGHLIARRGVSELDRRAKREESMRTLRWAGELALAEDGGRARVGVAALDALSASPWLQAEDQAFIDAVLMALITTGAPNYPESGDADVFQLDDVRKAKLTAAGDVTTQEENP